MVNVVRTVVSTMTLMAILSGFFALNAAFWGGLL